MKRHSAVWWVLICALAVAVPVHAELSPVQMKSRAFTPSGGAAALDEAVASGRASGHFLVQLNQPVDSALREELEGAGVRLTGYIPDNTWIASLEARAMTDATVRSRIAWAGELLPSDKMPVRWRDRIFGDWAIQPDGRIEMRVRYHEDVDADAADVALLDIGAEVVEPLGLFKGSTILGFPTLIPQIAALDEVLWIIEGLPEPELHNDGCRQITRAEILQGDGYWLTGYGVLVGVWDGGIIDEGHDDFIGRLIVGEAGSTSSHATHVAGTVGGSGVLSQPNGGGALQWRGMAPEVIFFSYDFNGNVPQEIAAVVASYAIELETNSWSWGVNGNNCYLYGNYEFWAPEFDAIANGSEGTQLNIIFSAANERDDGDCPLIEGQYGCVPPPGTAKNVITVGATNSDDDTMTGFSSWGPVDDGRLKPEITAPGCERTGEGAVRSAEPGDIYSLKCGTSMAAPTVTGILALLVQLYNLENEDLDPVPAMIKALVIATSVDLGTPGPDYAFGHGRIDAKASADALLHDSQTVETLAQGQTRTVTFPVPAGTPSIRIAAAWHDPPGNPLANPALVNNLNLTLVDPLGGTHLPWILNPAAPSQPATRGVDNRNNAEVVQVADPIPGIWTARLTGTTVPQGPQMAAIVGYDTRPPGAPIGFVVAGSTPTTIDLIWGNAVDGDRKGTIIARHAGTELWSGPIAGETYTVGQEVAPDAVIVYVGDIDHSEIPFTDTGLAAGETYEYAAYTFDDMHNYSVAARATGTAGDPASAEDAEQARRILALGPPQPNPAHTQVAFAFSIPAETYASLRIYDPSGRLVRVLLHAPMSGGDYAATWDGRDDEGRPVGPGIYYCELRAGGERLSRQISWLR